MLHGVGEPMLVKNLPRMVRYLKDRGTYVLFNTNGTVLNERNGRALIDAGLDELRVSLDAANAKSYLAIRGKNYFDRILKTCALSASCRSAKATPSRGFRPWLTGLSETIAELPDFVHVAADIGVKEVYLQRLVFFADKMPIGMARPDQALYEQMSAARKRPISMRQPRSRRAARHHVQRLGRRVRPGMSLKRQDDGSPWSLCRRPWTVMYFTANGRALPCCIAPFSQRGYENYTLGDATQQTLREIWNGARYQDFREALCPTSRRRPAPAAACAGASECKARCRRSRVALIIPDPERGGVDRRRDRRRSARCGRSHHRRGRRQPDARRRGASRRCRGDRCRRAAMAAPASPARRRRSDADISCSWTATAPTTRRASPA